MGRSRSNDELAPEIAMELNSSGSPDRIALFGGTYDPVHHGHISIARAAKDALNLDLVIFIPCRQSPHKDDSPIASQAQRLAMLDLALADEPWAESSDIEHLLPEPSFSWVTAEAMTELHPNAKLYWLMGADQWSTIESWSRPSYLAEMVEFIVHDRNQTPSPITGFQAHHIEGHHPASATKIREQNAIRMSDEWLHPDVVRYLQEEAIYS